MKAGGQAVLLLVLTVTAAALVVYDLSGDSPEWWEWLDIAASTVLAMYLGWIAINIAAKKVNRKNRHCRK